MRFREGRSYGIVERKPEGVFRVLCLGDSMVYGQGVDNGETLPSMLERFLNRAVWNRWVEVINEGTCGFSVYDEWHQFIQRGHRLRPDLILLILSNNDAELFGVQQGYVEHVMECWSREGVHLPYFRLLLKDVARELKALRIPVLVCFYEIYEGELREICTASIKEACEWSGLDFLDLSVDFLGASSAQMNRGMRVDDLDGHPSAQAHRTAALRLTRHLIRKGYIGAENDRLTPEGTLYGGLLKTSERMLRAGYRPHEVLYRLSETLLRKRESNLRLRLSEPERMSDDDFRELLAAVRSLYERSLILLSWQTYSTVLRFERQRFLTACRNADRLIQSLLKKLFIIEKNLTGDPELRYQPVADESVEKRERIDPAAFEYEVARWLTLLARVNETLSVSRPPASEGLEGLAARIDHGMETERHHIGEYLAEGERILKACQHVLSLHDHLSGPGNGNGGEAGAADPVLSELSSLAAEAGLLLELLRLEEAQEPPPLPEQPVCRVDVLLTSVAEEPFNLVVRLDSLVPDYPAVEDHRMVQNDGGLRRYHFEFPLTCLGRFRLSFPGNGRSLSPDDGIRVERMELSSGRRAMTIDGRDLVHGSDGSLETPLIWDLNGSVETPDAVADGMRDELFAELPYTEYRIPEEEMEKDDGYCYTFSFRTRASSLFTGSRVYRGMRLFEDGRPLRFDRTPRYEIVRLGGGRYSLTPGKVLFSSSDNTDPRTNGRVYTLLVPTFVYLLENLSDGQIERFRL